MGAFSEMLGWMKGAAEAKPEELTDCPNCDYHLTKKQATGELHCKLCGWPRNTE